MQALAKLIMRGRVQAIASVVSLALLSLIISPLAIFTIAAVALVTLVHGYREGLINLLASTVILSVFAGISLNQPSIGLELALKFWLPAWFLASIVLNRGSMSYAIIVATGVACLLVLGFYFLSDPATYWYEVINKQLIPMLKNAGMQVQEGAKAEKVWLYMSKMMTGSALALFLVLQILSLLLARHWQALLYNPGGFGQEFRELRFGSAVTNIVVVIAVFALATSNEVAVNLFFIVIVLMMFQGLAVIHSLVKKCKLNSSILIVTYAFMIITLQHAAMGLLFVAVVGLLDNWLNLRFRLCANKA